MKPFAHRPGRDVALDRPSSIDVARCYYEQRFRIAEDAGRLRQLIAAVNWPNDLGPAQWAQWYSVALGFAPDLIVELGRGFGNSTAAFAQAAWRLGRTRVVSLCQTGDWTATVAPKIARVVERDWFRAVDARRADILSVDYARLIGEHRRVLLLWDAHGFEIADLVLGEILPRLVDREHLLLLHDISDNRYGRVPRAYEGQALWRGQRGPEGRRVNIGLMNSMQDQVIALADFSARNDLEVGSADHEYAQYFDAHPEHADEMARVAGQDFFSRTADWAFLTLAGRQGPFHFPAISGGRAAAHRSVLVTDGLAALPAVVKTAATPWAYAARVPWQAASAPPPNVESWLRCRIRVEGGPIGVSLLSADEQRFEFSQVTSATADPVDLLLPVADVARHGPLVIHTWDVPQAGRVMVDEMSLVW